MKISIDTKEDSHEDLKKVIRMLQHLVGENPLSNDTSLSTSSSPSSYSNEATSAFGALFGSDSSSGIASSASLSSSPAVEQYGATSKPSDPDDYADLETY